MSSRAADTEGYVAGRGSVIRKAYAKYTGPGLAFTTGGPLGMIFPRSVISDPYRPTEPDASSEASLISNPRPGI